MRIFLSAFLLCFCSGTSAQLAIFGEEALGYTGGGGALTDGLLHYWDLDDDNVWADSVGDWDLTENGAVTVTTTSTPDGGGAAVFDATGEYLDLTARAWDGAVSELSVSAWVRVTSLPTTGSWVFSWRDETTDRLVQLYASTSNNDWRGSLFDSVSSTSSVDSTTTVSTGIWVHLVITDDGTTRRLYVNGTEEDTDTTSIGSYTTNSMEFAIGTASWVKASSNTRVIGQITMVGIWERDLTSSEVTELYNSGAGKRHVDL